VRTTVRRLPPTPLQAPDVRNQCACKVHALGEIASFIAGLDGRHRRRPDRHRSNQSPVVLTTCPCGTAGTFLSTLFVEKRGAGLVLLFLT
jgi:hypothetical protein